MKACIKSVVVVALLGANSQLSIGEPVPADLRLVEVSGLEIVEGILTGESVPAPKSIRTIRKRVCVKTVLNLLLLKTMILIIISDPEITTRRL